MGSPKKMSSGKQLKSESVSIVPLLLFVVEIVDVLRQVPPYLERPCSDAFCSAAIYRST